MKAAEIASKLAYEANRQKGVLTSEEEQAYQDVLNAIESAAKMGHFKIVYQTQITPAVQGKLLQEGFHLAVPRSMCGIPVTIAWPELK